MTRHAYCELVLAAAVLVPACACPGAVTVSFAENFDDAIQLKIDGEVWLEDLTYNQPTASPPKTVAVGWYDFEVRFGQATGSVGPFPPWQGICLGWDAQGRGSVDPDNHILPPDGLFRVSAGIPGLLAGRLSNTGEPRLNTTDANPATSVEPGLGAMNWAGYGPDSGGLWPDHSTWVYSGQINLPEPAALSLLAVGALALVRPRRR